jgi:hypothetical protein
MMNLRQNSLMMLSDKVDAFLRATCSKIQTFNGEYI